MCVGGGKNFLYRHKVINRGSYPLSLALIGRAFGSCRDKRVKSHVGLQYLFGSGRDQLLKPNVGLPYLSTRLCNE